MTTDAYTLAADLLARVAAYFTAAGVDLPSVQYVAPGDSRTIAYDGECVMVNVDFVAAGQPGADRSGTPAFPLLLRYAQYSVTVIRDAASLTDSGDPPAPLVIQADAQANITDTLILHQALEDVRVGCQSPGGWVGPGTPVVIGRTQPVGPQGGVMAVVGQVQVLLA